ncbi:MAG: PIH1 domain-containing protein 1 [Marteilia pararefringens]
MHLLDQQQQQQPKQQEAKTESNFLEFGDESPPDEILSIRSNSRRLVEEEDDDGRQVMDMQAQTMIEAANFTVGFKYFSSSEALKMPGDLTDSLRRAEKIVPIPGLCIKFLLTSNKSESNKVYFNICHHSGLPCPIELSDEELVKIIDSRDASQFRLPIAIGEIKQIRDVKQNLCYSLDCLIASEYFDQKILKSSLHRAIMENILIESFLDKLSKSNFSPLDPQIDPASAIYLKKKQIGDLQTFDVKKNSISTFNNGYHTKKIDMAGQSLIEEVETEDSDKLQPVKFASYVIQNQIIDHSFNKVHLENCMLLKCTYFFKKMKKDLIRVVAKKNSIEICENEISLQKNFIPLDIDLQFSINSLSIVGNCLTFYLQFKDFFS